MKLKDLIDRDSLLKEGRSQGLSFDKAYRLFLDNCTEYRAFLTQIFRGVNGFNLDYGVVKPKQAAEKRQSAYTKNYYTLIIDNSKFWNDFPDRGESIVCNADYPSLAAYYGTLYLVIPYDNANFGIAPNSDIWRSFDVHLEHFNDMIEDISTKSYRYRDKSYEEPPQSNFEKFKNYLLKVDKALKSRGKDYEGYSNLMYGKYTGQLIKPYVEMSSEFDNLYEYLEWFLNPYRNDFEQMIYSSNFKVSRRQEVWTDSPSLLIKHDKVTEFFEKVNKNSDRDIDYKWLRTSYKNIK